MAKVTVGELTAHARTLEGQVLHTLSRQRRPFTVAVAQKGLTYTPESTRKPRPNEWRYIERVLACYGESASLRPGDYRELTRNASYVLAVLDSLVRGPSPARTAAPRLGEKLAPPASSLSPAADASAAEGQESLRLHRVRERSRGLVTRKKRSVLAASGRLACEACGFDFKAAYGPRGVGFAECHHDRPLSASAGERVTPLSELSVVCANCHRMLHRRPWVSVAELRAVVGLRPGG